MDVWVCLCVSVSVYRRVLVYVGVLWVGVYGCVRETSN